MPDSSGAFASEVINLYTERIGHWSYIIIASSAFSAMFSTTLVLFDGYARAMDRTWALLFSNGQNSRTVYNAWIIIGAIGGYLIITQFLTNFTTLIDLATVISFLVAPIIAIANHRLVFSSHMPR